MGHLRYACLVMFYVTLAFVSYLEARRPWSGPLLWPAVELLIRMVFGLLVVAACVTDAQARRHPLTDGGRLVAYLAPPLTGAFYLIWSRGWRGILWLVVNLVVFVVVSIIAASFANAVTQWQLAPLT